MRFPGALIVGIAVAACDGDEVDPALSGNVPDDRLTVRVALASNGEVAQLVASLSDGATLALSGGDRLVAGAVGEAEEDLAAVDNGYAAQFATTAELFVLALVRGNGTRFETTLEMPPAFTITGPDEPVSRAAPIEIAWAPVDAEQTMQLDVYGACLDRPLRLTRTDTGSLAVSPADLFVNDTDADCDLDLFLFRRRHSTMGLEGLASPGTATLEQVRDLVLSTTP